MPKKTAIINYHNCEPKNCQGGVCVAVLVCKHKVLKQETPYEKPDPPMVCVSCGACVVACKSQAILLM